MGNMYVSDLFFTRGGRDGRVDFWSKRTGVVLFYVRRQAERVEAENAVFVISNNRINNYCQQSHSKFNTYVCTSYAIRMPIYCTAITSCNDYKR